MLDTDAVQTLARTIDGVVSVPYDVSLHPLLNILQNSPLEILECWYHHKTCQIPALYERLTRHGSVEVDGLPFRVLAALCKQPDIRNAFICEEQNIPALMLQRFATTNNFDECMSFFKHPMPEGLPLPRETGVLVRSIMNNVASWSHSVWLRNLRVVLQAIHGHELSVYDSEDGELAYADWQLAVNSTDHECHLDFLCIASEVYDDFKHREASSITDAGERITSMPHVRQWHRIVRSMFEGTQVNKTFRATLIRTLYFVSSASENTTAKAREYIEVARCVFVQIRPDLLQHTIQDQNNLEALQRLFKKTFQSSTDVKLQALIYEIFSKFDLGVMRLDSSTLIKSLVERLDGTSFDDQFSRLGLVFSALKSLRSAIDTDADGLVNDQDDLATVLNTFLQLVFLHCEPGQLPSYSISRGLISIQQSIKVLDDLLERSSTVCHLLVEGSNSIRVPAWWPASVDPGFSAYATNPNRVTNCKGHNLCRQTLEYLRLDVIRNVSYLLLKSACISTAFMDKVTSLRLIQQFGRPKLHNKSENICTWPSVKIIEPGIVHTFENFGGQNDEQWQPLLELQLGSTITTIQHHVQKAIQHATSELQYRCDTVERPLNEVQGRLNLVQQELKEERATSEAARLWYEHESCQRNIEAEKWNSEKQSMLEQLALLGKEKATWNEREKELQEKIKTSREMQNRVLALLGSRSNEETIT